MALSLKELIVALTIAVVVFHFGKPIALQFSTERDFSRRRNIWLLLTTTAFLSPNFWIFALLAGPALLWGGRRDANPAAFYLLLMNVVPAVPVQIPVAGINQLFSLDIYRLLAFCVLIPAAWRLRYSKTSTRPASMATDYLLLAYGALQIALFIPPDLHNHAILHDSATNVLRHTFLFLLDTYVLYYVASRSCTNRRAILEALAAFCLSCMLMATVAIFESLRHWLLYAEMAARWSNNPLAGFYFVRDSAVRAQASSGNVLALAYLLAIGFGFWLCLQRYVKSLPARIAAPLILGLGLLVTYSRGAWIGAVIIYFAVAVLGPRALSRTLKAVGIALLIAAVIGISPLGDRIIRLLPFVGQPSNAAAQAILYRQELIERAWTLIQQRPLFGDQLAYSKLQDLRQGQGIIDLVNTYIQVTLFYGFIGVLLFLAFIICGLVKAQRFARSAMSRDPDLALIGVNLNACILGTLFMLGTCSFILGYQKMFFALAGLAVAYSQLGRSISQPSSYYSGVAVQAPAVVHKPLRRAPERR